MQRKLDYEKIKELHAQNLNDNEIAKIIGACVNGVRYARLDVMKLPNVVKDDTITPEMEEIIIGTILGDAWIGYVHKGCTAPKYQIIHAMSQYEYTKHIFEKFDLEFSIKKDNSLYLKHCSNEIFRNLIRDYLTSDMLYKL